MTDDLDPSRLLASAALDNEVTADERAQVESSAGLLDEMSVYAEVRDEVRSVDVPAAARESGITAALAAFDAMSGAGAPIVNGPGTTTATTPAPARSSLAPVVSLQARRQRQMRWLGGAAAAAVVGVLTVGALASTSGEDYKSSSATVPATVPVLSEAKSAESAAAPAADSADSATYPALETADSTAASTAGTTAAANAPATETAAGGQSSDSTVDAAGTTAAVAAFDPWTNAPSLVTQEQLVAFATEIPSVLATAATPADATTTTIAPDTGGAAGPETTAAESTADTAAGGGLADGASYQACVDRAGLPSAPAIYRGARVIVERDDTAGEAIVVEPVRCVVLDRFPVSAP